MHVYVHVCLVFHMVIPACRPDTPSWHLFTVMPAIQYSSSVHKPCIRSDYTTHTHIHVGWSHNFMRIFMQIHAHATMYIVHVHVIFILRLRFVLVQCIPYHIWYDLSLASVSSSMALEHCIHYEKILSWWGQTNHAAIPGQQVFQACQLSSAGNSQNLSDTTCTCVRFIIQKCSCIHKTIIWLHYTCMDGVATRL